MPVKSLGYTLLTKTFWIYCLTLIALPAGYFNKVIISADLSVAEVGVLYSIISLFGIIVMYNDLGFKESMVYFLPKFLVEKKHDNVKSTLVNMLVIQIITAILISIALYLGSDRLAQMYFKYPQAGGVLQMMILYLILQCLNPDSIFLVFQDTFWHKMLNTLNLVGIMICSILVHFYGYHTIKRFAVGYILIGSILTLTGSIVLWHKHLKTLRSQSQYYRNWTELVGIVKYALGVLISNNLLVIIASMDLLLIMGLLGPIDAGYYSNYITIVGIMPALIGPIFGLVMPLTSDLHARQEYGQIKLLNSILTNYALAGASISAGFGMIFGPQIAIGLLGQKFMYSGEIAQIGFAGIPITVGIWIIFVMFASTGVVMSRIKILLIGVCINLAVITTMIMLGLGTKGVALGVIITWTVLYRISRTKIDPLLKPDVDIKRIVGNAGFGLLISAGLWFLFEDTLQGLGRRDMLFTISGIGAIYLLIVAGFNYRRIITGIQTIKTLYMQHHN